LNPGIIYIVSDSKPVFFIYLSFFILTTPVRVHGYDILEREASVYHSHLAAAANVSHLPGRFRMSMQRGRQSSSSASPPVFSSFD